MGAKVQKKSEKKNFLMRLLCQLYSFNKGGGGVFCICLHLQRFSLIERDFNHILKICFFISSKPGTAHRVSLNREQGNKKGTKAKNNIKTKIGNYFVIK